jgi:hypothetical protein
VTRALATIAVVIALGAVGLAQQPAPAADGTQGFTYNPEGRRDPFVSLLKRGTELQQPGGQRPAGLAGLAAADVTLKGT